MATYVVGDIQGCFKAFQCVLKKVKFNAAKDTLWSVGDLINRGDDNLATLRWFYEHRHAVRVVLGNHDLHMLAVHAGVGGLSRSDNFGDVLRAPDAHTLLYWLQQQPLFFRDGTDLLVHAGIPPIWSSEDTARFAAEVSECLQGPHAKRFFKTMYGNEPARWSDHISGYARLRVITNYLTRMRYCTASGMLDLKSKGPQPRQKKIQKEKLAPWFAHPSQLSSEERVLFGHWASLNGRTNSEQFIGLDTGCVWGQTMTLICRETGKLTRCDCDGY